MRGLQAGESKLGDILKIGGSILGGIVGGPVGAAIGGGLGGLLGGSDDPQAQAAQQSARLSQQAAEQAGAQVQQSAQQAGQQAQQGFNYLQQSPLGASYLPQGGAATNAISSLLGLPTAQPVAAPQQQMQQQPPQQQAAGPSAGILAAQNTALGHAKGANNSPLQDIRQALASSRPISDASWAQAGYGPGGSLPGQAQTPAAQMVQAQQQQQPAPQAPTPQQPQDPNAGFQNYLNSTGYNFRLGEGIRGITANNAQRGLLNSGATLKASQRYGQNLASGEFNNYLGQVGTVADRGLQAGGVIGNAAQGAGLAGAGYTANAGQAQAGYTAEAGGSQAKYNALAGATRAANSEANYGGALSAIGQGFTPNAAGQTPFGQGYNYLKGLF